jgi:hypothetical protein
MEPLPIIMSSLPNRPRHRSRSLEGHVVTAHGLFSELTFIDRERGRLRIGIAG